MSIATYEFFKAHGSKIIYTNLGQPNRITDFDGGDVEACGQRLRKDEFITGYKFHLQKPAH